MRVLLLACVALLCRVITMADFLFPKTSALATLVFSVVAAAGVR
jgi:hypothetical protein